MYRIVICDDEPCFLEETNKLMMKYIDQNDVIASIKNYSNEGFLLDDIQSGIYYDIYILDIKMSKHLGTDIAREVRKHSVESIIIFLTSYNQNALESFELEIFRYICKSSFKEHLPLALSAAFSKLKLQEGKYYLLSNSKRSQKIFFKDILYLYKEGKNSIFVLFNEQIKVRDPLFEVYSKLDKEDFIQVDRCYIVNIQYIHKVDNVEGKITLKNKIVLDVSKSRMQEIKNIVSQFWGSQV